MASGTIKAVVGRSDIVDNLTTNDSTKVLSAKQGKVLSDQIATAPVTFTSYADVKSGIANKASTMSSGSMASFDFRANYTAASDELPAAYYTCVVRKYDNNSYVADIISNTGVDYKLSYAGNTWRLVSLSNQIGELKFIKIGNIAGNTPKDVTLSAYARVLLVGMSTADVYCIASCVTTSQGVASSQSYSKSNNLTITPGTYKVTISHTSAVNLYLYALVLEGTISA